MIEVTVRELPWPFPRAVYAVSIWPFIFYEWWVRDNLAIQAHERYHWNEQKNWFVLPWFIAYVCLFPFYGGGRRHPMEKQAYVIQDKVTEDTRKRDGQTFKSTMMEVKSVQPKEKKTKK